MKKSNFYKHFCKLLAAALTCLPLTAFAQNQPVIAIIIDDLGDNWERGVSLVNIPGQLTLSILPHKKYSKELAIAANDQYKEIMLHLPMQAIDPEKVMGPGGLTQEMKQNEVVDTLHDSLLSIPYVSGINNHMGSLLTSRMTHMTWLMQEIKQMGNLYFVDSRTHHSSVANFVASENSLSHTQRDIFLDHVVEPMAIDYQFHRLIQRAEKHGYALAIGHPHEETIEYLQEKIPELEAAGITLVSVSEYIRLQQQRESIWHASLSHSPKGVKN